PRAGDVRCNICTVVGCRVDARRVVDVRWLDVRQLALDVELAHVPPGQYVTEPTANRSGRRATAPSLLGGSDRSGALGLLAATLTSSAALDDAALRVRQHRPAVDVEPVR